MDNKPTFTKLIEPQTGYKNIILLDSRGRFIDRLVLQDGDADNNYKHWQFMDEYMDGEYDNEVTPYLDGSQTVHYYRKEN